METVYLETSFVSYLVAKPSRDRSVAERQDATTRWWSIHGNQYVCFASQIVINEASAGDPFEVAKRLEFIGQIDRLTADERVEELTLQFMESGVLPEKAFTDASHVAMASIHGMKYLLTWNCKHLANDHISGQLAKVCVRAGYRIPIIR